MSNLAQSLSSVPPETTEGFPILPTSEKAVVDIADFFKVVGDSTRLKILFTISNNEMCVLHIAEALSMSQSAISHQLRVLREHHIVKSRREGKQMIYSLDDNHVVSIVREAIVHLEHKHRENNKEHEDEKSIQN